MYIYIYIYIYTYEHALLVRAGRPQAPALTVGFRKVVFRYVCIRICMFVYVCVCVCVYLYKRGVYDMCVYVIRYIYIYIYTHIHVYVCNVM